MSSMRSNTPSHAIADTSYTHPYTCNACQVAFRNSDLQRTHMHSDWHRYNLKRRVASLPPLSSETFADKVLTAQSSATEIAARASFQRSCGACQKNYYSENAFKNHVGSQKHRMRIAILHSISGASVDGTETASVMSSTFSLGDPIAVDSLDNNQNRPVTEKFSEVVKSFKQTTIDHEQFDPQESAHPQPLVAAVESPAQLSGANTADIPDPSPEDSLLLCLFCNYRSPTTPLNVGHMSKIHGMFIPEQSYLTDVKGLIEYLSRKIDVIHECLYCGKWKNSKTGIQTHMRDKGHCMIAFDTEEAMIEVGQFYDFSSTYSESEDDDERGDGVDEEPTTRRGGNVDGDVEDGEGWETDSSASSLDSNDLTAVPLDNSHRLQRLDRHAHHSRQDPRPHHNKDGWHSHAHHHPHAVYHSDFELHLPSGRTAGHRSLARYYRQNLHNYPTATERLERAAIMHDRQSDSDDDERTGRHSRGRQGQMITRANGGTGMIGVTDAKKREVQAVEKREMKRSQREQGRNQWKVDKQGNSQKHFRDPLLQ